MPLISVHDIEMYCESHGLAEDLQARLPDSRLIQVDGGHWFPFTGQWAHYAGDVAAFLTVDG